MQTVSKSKLKARMLEYLRAVEATGEELIITDKNRPVLRIVPILNPVRAEDLFGQARKLCRLDEEAMLSPLRPEDYPV